jgi:hypothetical protein
MLHGRQCASTGEIDQSTDGRTVKSLTAVTRESGISQSWSEHQAKLLRLSQCQLFFVGGAPRSGTTWLQRLLDSHPAVSCGGEGLFMKHLAEPLETMMTARRRAVEAKNLTVFRNFGGYVLPESEDVEHLLATAVLLALERQAAGKPCRAIGEKTPENVFMFARLKRLFPDAKFIGIARDPRDLITSAWYFFHQPTAGEDKDASKAAFVRSVFPSLNQGAHTMLALTREYPTDAMIVTYEGMSAAPKATAARLFDFLGVADDEALVSDCVARTSFSAMSGRHQTGAVRDGLFFRKGAVGDWKSTLSAEMNEAILQELGWMFPAFGWTP